MMLVMQAPETGRRGFSLPTLKFPKIGQHQLLCRCVSFIWSEAFQFVRGLPRHLRFS